MLSKIGRTSLSTSCPPHFHMSPFGIVIPNSFVLSLLFLLGIGNGVSWISLWRRSRRACTVTKAQDPETSSPAGNGRASIGRVHVALVNAWRALAFRSTLHLGSNYTINLTEVFVTASYITILFAWSLMNSKFFAAAVSRTDEKFILTTTVRSY